MIRPCGVGEVDGLGGGAGIEFREEESTEMDGAGAGDSLQAADLVKG